MSQGRSSSPHGSDGDVSPPPTAELRRAFDDYVRQSQTERRDIARWWQLEQEGGTGTDAAGARREAAEGVRTSEAHRLETERTLKQMFAQAAAAPSPEDDASLIHDLQVALTKSEASRSDALRRLDSLASEVAGLRDAATAASAAAHPPPPSGGGDAAAEAAAAATVAAARSEARATLAESRAAELEAQVSQLRRACAEEEERSQRRADRRVEEEEVVEGRVRRLEWDLADAVELVAALKNSVQERDAELERQARSLQEGRLEKEGLARQMAARVRRLESEAAALRGMADERASVSPPRGRSPTNSTRVYRRADSYGAGDGGGGGGPAVRTSSPTSTMAGGGGRHAGGGLRLGLEVADSIYCGRLGGALRYDGVRVVTASRPAAPTVHDGDVIVKVDNVAVNNLDTFRRTIQNLDPTVSVMLTLRRKGPSGTTGTSPPLPPHHVL